MLTVRTATPEDAGAISDLCAEIQELHHQALPTFFKPGSAATFPTEHVKELMSEPLTMFIMAVVDQDIAGYVFANRIQSAENAFQYAFERIHIDQIGVHQLYRRQGCGQALMDAVKNLAVSQNIPLITLSTWGFNHRAHEFFASQGFEAFLHNYWFSVNPPE